MEYLLQRPHHELTFFHERMRQGETLGVHVDFIVEQYVDVDDAVVIDSVRGLLGASHLPLDVLGHVEKPQGGQRRADKTNRIEETILRRESPGLGFMKRRQGTNVPCLLFKKLDCLA